MNTVILLNPNQNVKIKNTVKEILKKNNLENFYFLPEKPVLIDISHFYSEEKNLKEEIQKFIDRIGARTLIVERVEADEQVQSNHADANVHDYTYNTYIHNNRTLKDLEKIAYKFTDLFLKGEDCERIYW